MEESAIKAGAARVWSPSLTRTSSLDELGSVAAVNEAAFGTPIGSLTQAIETPHGAVIVRPEERIEADQSAFAQAQTSLREQLLEQKQSEHLQNWLKELRARAKPDGSS